MKLLINNNYSTSFCAKPVGKTTVLKKNIFGKYNPLDINLIQLDVYNKSDMKLLDSLDERWNNENKKIKNALHYYLGSINNNARKKLSSNNLSNREFYALTRQKFFLNHLNPKKILGVAQIHLDTANLEYIQVRPKYQYKENEPRKIKHIGKHFLESLKEFTNGKGIRVYSDDNAKNFYKSQGGYPDENCRDIFYL